MGVLSLFRIRVAVNLCWETGDSFLFIFDFPLFLMARKGSNACINGVASLMFKAWIKWMFQNR
jgi:hypothetical protein